MLDPVDLPDEVIQQLQEQAHDWAVAHGIMIAKKPEAGETSSPGNIWYWASIYACIRSYWF